MQGGGILRGDVGGWSGVSRGWGLERQKRRLREELGRKQRCQRGWDVAPCCPFTPFCFLVKGALKLMLLIGALGVDGVHVCRWACSQQKWDGTSWA